jgi:hypothetical protein
MSGAQGPCEVGALFLARVDEQALPPDPVAEVAEHDGIDRSSQETHKERAQ